MYYLFGLIGYPIKHSLSPWIHEQFMKQTNTRGEYTIFDIEQNADFKAEINKLLQKNVHKLRLQHNIGLNITIAYTETIINELNDIDEQGRNIGAVNTVLNLDGKLIGYNTDGLGYVRSLEKPYPCVKETEPNRLLLGA